METPDASSGITQSSTNSNGGGGLNLAAELNLANDFEATQKANEVDKTVHSTYLYRREPGPLFKLFYLFVLSFI